LSGPEAYFIDVITDYLEDHVLDESERAFNQTVVYGRDVEWDSLVETLKRFPMMSPYQVVIVKEAQSIRNMKEKLTDYLQHPVDTTILVVCFKYKTTSDKKLINLIKSKGIYFESKELREDKVPDWIIEYLRRRGFRVTQKAAYLITEYLGNDLGKVANELEKLTLVLEKGTEINTHHIEDNIGISKDYNSFELVNALSIKNHEKAFRIVNYFAQNPKQHPLVMTIGSLFNYFSKVLGYHYLRDKSQSNAASQLRIPPFFVKDYIQGARTYSAAKCAHIVRDIRETDNKSKGIDNPSTPDGELLKELVYKILN
jgi:DNA polymerase-3 subunit delta